MFSFGEADDVGTPFFDDNFENHSIFNSDAPMEFNAFDLFNSNCKTGGPPQSTKPHPKRVAIPKLGRDSKKSLILELDEFDRKEAFQSLELSYNRFQEESEPQPQETENTTK
jgi:hypothetical protein